MNGRSCFGHTDFEYAINYLSRPGAAEERQYEVTSRVVLYAYDYEQKFILPMPSFKGFQLNDYRQISAVPYNDFFWRNHEEYNIRDSLNTNFAFYNDTISVSNKLLFSVGAGNRKGLFESPYVLWSPARFRIRDIVTDSMSAAAPSAAIKANEYQLNVKILADLNVMADTCHLLTATIFDPFDSYYRLPSDQKSLCFINTFFDLCETQRMRSVQALTAEGCPADSFETIYKAQTNIFEQEQQAYLKAVDRGTNEQKMTMYNQQVSQITGIDNIAIFNPFEKSE